ncbi:hypothetical protein Scep_003633 [Stephania cephalantha]|uniref:Uncharacterized protein n=1 Tax=Stephania cephalantha TaxID=152367 RepID=A0AAP0PWI2_9MAGN
MARALPFILRGLESSGTRFGVSRGRIGYDKLCELQTGYRHIARHVTKQATSYRANVVRGSFARHARHRAEVLPRHRRPPPAGFHSLRCRRRRRARAAAPPPSPRCCGPRAAAPCRSLRAVAALRATVRDPSMGTSRIADGGSRCSRRREAAGAKQRMTSKWRGDGGGGGCAQRDDVGISAVDELPGGAARWRDLRWRGRTSAAARVNEQRGRRTARWLSGGDAMNEQRQRASTADAARHRRHATSLQQRRVR